MAFSQAKLVGEHSLTKLLEILREHGSVEEYQDVLDLITRLISTKDKDASIANTNIILSQNRNVDLLLDLLEHEDMTIGVMTSQILSEIHHLNGAKLESEIQSCPEGMTKLLRRLPDTSREEVRDQALVFVQQLTHNNEEMKKNFVFNEGFEIIFRIVQRELSKSSDISIVTQDCLLICYHVLTDSEICQRLFYGMGQEWISILEHFFDPENLDSYKPPLTDDDGDVRHVGKDSAWYADPKMLACGVLAVGAIANSLAIPNAKHQDACVSFQNATTSKSLLFAASYWFARRGPSELLDAVLSFFVHVMKQNPTIGHHVLSFVLALPHSNLPGKSIPTHAEPASLHFSWKPYPDKDARYITLPSLFVERYIYRGAAWPATAMPLDTNSNIMSDFKSIFDSSTAEGLADACLKIVETWLEADSTVSDLVVQYTIAPPPPLRPEEFDDNGNMTAESSKPIGKIVLTLLADSVNRLINVNSLQVSGGLVASSASSTGNGDAELVERSCNILAVVFIYGTSLAKELSTAITTQHLGSASSGMRPLPILSHLLSSAGRLIKSSSASGISVMVSILRLLAIVSSGCERVINLLFEDPSNLFVVDLASTASENAGVSPLIQLASSFLIGCCYQSLPKDTKESDSGLSRRSFMTMIDTRIGLQRFTDILKRPLQPANDTSLASYFFRSSGFKKFYESQVALIRKDIFEHYAGSGRSSEAAGSTSAASYEQIIEMQREKIDELERLLASASVASNPIKISNSISNANDELSKKDELIASLRQTIAANDAEYENIQKLMLDQANHINQLESLLQSSASSSGPKAATSLAIADHDDEILRLKKQILDLAEEKRLMNEAITQRDKKIELLEVEALSSSSSSQLHEKKVTELEARNSDLKQQIWMLESEIKDLKQSSAAISATATITQASPPSDTSSEITTSHENWKELVAAVEELVTCLELPIYDPTVSESTSGFHVDSFFKSDQPMTMHVLALSDTIRECSSSLGQLADRCSDMTQGLSSTIMNINMLVFESNEQSRFRIEECFEKVAGFVHEVNDQCQLLESSLTDAEAEKMSVIRMNERLEEENRSLTQSDKQPQFSIQSTEAVQRISELEEQVGNLESALAAEKEAFASAGISYSALLKQETDTWQHKYHALESSYKEYQERSDADLKALHHTMDQMKLKNDASLREATQALAEAKRDLNQSRNKVLSLDEQLQLHKNQELALQKQIHEWKDKCHAMETAVSHDTCRDMSAVQDLEAKIQEMDKLLLQREAEYQTQLQLNHENIVQKCLSDLAVIESRLESQQQDHEKKLSTMQKEIETKEHIIGQLEERLKQYVEDMMSMEAAHDKRLDHLNSESEGVKQALFKLSEEYTAYKKEHEDQKSKVIAHYDARIQDLEAQIELEKEVFEQTINQHADAQAGLQESMLKDYEDKLESDYMKKIEHMKQAYESEKEQLKRNIYQSISQQIDDIRKQDEMLAVSLMKQLEGSSADLLHAKEEYLSLQRKHDDLRSEYSILQLQQESLSLAEQKQQFQLSRQHQEEKVFASEIHDWKDKVHALEAQLEGMQMTRKLEQRDLENNLREEYSKQIHNAENQWKVKQNVLDGLKSQLQNEKVKTSELREQLATLQDDVR
jgi:hypothetical protein